MQPVQAAQVQGPAKTLEPQVGSGPLPDVFKHQFFKVNEEWSGKKLSSWIGNNPTVDLCLRLATYGQAPGGKGCYDPKPNLKGSHRLYEMIGKHLPSGVFRRMIFSSSRQWKFVEECWIANMHTVLLNQYFDPVKRDRLLYRSIQKYKIWFLKFAFEGNIRNVFSSKKNKTFKVFNPINFDRLLQGLKSIAGCLQWAALSDMKDHNADPPKIPYWKGYHSETGDLELVWFDGHLLRWRDCLYNLEFTDRELANLCQIRTFGRALPCPTKAMCVKAFDEQVEILSTERVTRPEVLQTVEVFSAHLSKRLGVFQMPVHTHVSVSTSGCYEKSQREGGLAGEISDWISEIDVPISEVRVGPSNGPGSWTIDLFEFINSKGSIIDIRDVYGELLFPRPKSFYVLGKGLRALGLKTKELTFLQALYCGAGLSTKRRKASKFIGEEALPSELGKTCLLLASSLALEQGEYLSDIDSKPLRFENYLFVGRFRIPFVTGTMIRHHCIYRPIHMPKTKLDCLAEPGAKTRPLGKNQAWFTLVTRAMRFMAEPIIARDGRARIGLRSTNKMWSFLKYLEKVGPQFEDPIGQSTDYKSATDLIPLDVLRAIWSGFLKSLPNRHPFWVFATLIVSQREMFFPNKFLKELPHLRNDGVLNRRGSFMGEPMSFLTLTLENLLVEEISDHYYQNPKIPLWVAPSRGEICNCKEPCCICGDDVAALRRNLRRILLFRRIATDMGWLFSWKEGISRRILIFCEDHTLLTGKGKEFRTLYIDVIKSRLLTTMSREHSDNRSSILGKGRMLSNQLDYFEDKNLKIAILGYFRNIFDRCFSYSIIKNEACKMPIYLPPCAGGMGLPIVDSLMPSFMWPYIGYIFHILDMESEADRFCGLQALQSLNSRVKHGLSSDVNPILREIFSQYTRALPSDKSLRGDRIYDDKFIINLLSEKFQVELPEDPYLKKYDFSSLRNEAARIGFVPLTSLPDEVERVLNFQKFLKGGSSREPRTFNKWLKDSIKYWRKVKDLESYRDIGKQRFKSVAALEKAITRGFSGWIYVGDDLDQMTLINSGPSLKISFSVTTSLGGKLRLYGDHFKE